MNIIKRITEFLGCVGAILLLASNPAMGGSRKVSHAHIRHVMLISIDGLHALDVARYVRTHPESGLAELSRHGSTFSNASTPATSDSFPGLLALVTGGSPISHGVFYDVSYDRTLFSPNDTRCVGARGTAVVFDERVDRYTPDHVSLDRIDAAKLPRKKDAHGKCVAEYPHDYLQATTIFEVVKNAGGRTAWSDKHPAYDLVNGPSGRGVDDLYTPEITNVDGFDATASVVCTVDNDALKIAAVMNQIAGNFHDGRPMGAAPELFGMDLQAVGVAQKLARDDASPRCNKLDGDRLRGQPGGYLDAFGTPTDVLAYGLDKTDRSLQQLIQALKDRGLFESTLVVVSAKHGQSPIDPAKVNKPGRFADLIATLPDSAVNPAAIAVTDAAACKSSGCGLVMDEDVVLIWLQDQSRTPAVATYLHDNAKALFIDYILAGDSLQLRFNNPLIDSRTPDLIVQPLRGTIYTHSEKKKAEHGGFSDDDIHVALIVSNPRFSPQTIKTPVVTSQVAVTIVAALGIDPRRLSAVRIEHTPGLPSIGR